MRYSIHFKNLNFPEIHVFVDSIESLQDRNKAMANLAVKDGESNKLCKVQTLSGEVFDIDFTTKAVRDAVTSCYTQQRDQVLEYGLGVQNQDGTTTPLEDLDLPTVGDADYERLIVGLKTLRDRIATHIEDDGAGDDINEEDLKIVDDLLGDKKS